MEEQPSVGHCLAVSIELGDQLYIGSLTATGTCTRELKERRRKLRVFHIGCDVHQVSLAGHTGDHLIPVLLFFVLLLDRLHGQSLAILIARTYIYTVATAETVHYVHLNAEAHVWELFSDSLEHLDAGFLLFFLGEDERTNRSVRTNVGTLVALYTVVSFPYRNESCSLDRKSVV